MALNRTRIPITAEEHPHTRPAAELADGHVPDALSVPLCDQFVTWLGWLVPDCTTGDHLLCRTRDRPTGVPVGCLSLLSGGGYVRNDDY